MPTERIRLDVGDRVGRLTIIGPIVTIGGKKSYSLARCDCGKEWMAGRTGIRSGRIKSCGCLAREVWAKSRSKHGLCPRGKRIPEYNTWASLIQRCENPKAAVYKHYGARGITVCERWHDFQLFYEDMGRSSKGTEIERIDNDRGYEPGNCRWATRHDQMRNTRMTKMVTVYGEVMCATDAAARIGVPPGRIFWRVHKYGMSHQQAINDLVRDL